ncbi:hypothetical protein LCGC14_0522640 [marine sediment metagenome]|uniref:Uncharacterized protein n=1 Tax=marine sediment metagenome TaxID=412755 RepID=A0A0F9SGC0_9ZZZZ
MGEKRDYTDHEIRRRYVIDLEKIFSVRAEDDLELYRKAALWWTAPNVVKFIWKDPVHIFASFLAVFGESDVVWRFPSVIIDDGCLAIEAILVDAYEGAPPQESLNNVAIEIVRAVF